MLPIETISKALVFQNQATNTSRTIYHRIQPFQTSMNLKPIIEYFINLHKHKLEFFVFSPSIGNFCQLTEPYILCEQMMLTPTVLIKFKIQESVDIAASNNSQEEEKKQRNKERTIREVIQNVKEWRRLHFNPRKNQTKINFQLAAKVIGISKKSLDDYYCQLRLGEKYGFDFDSNMDERIGVLRAFVKAHREKQPKNESKNEKHPKKLKIIQTTKSSRKKPVPNPETNASVFIPMPQISPVKEQSNYQMFQQNLVKEQSAGQQTYLTPMQRQQYKEFENQLYQSFSLIQNEPMDPFVQYNPKDYRNSSRKHEEYDMDMMW